MKSGVFKENLRIALQSIRGQLTRTILTALIITIGIMALVGILTSIDAIKSSLTGEFALLGANTFSIRNSGLNIQIGRGGQRPEVFPEISMYQAQEFKEKFKDQPALVSISYVASGMAEVEHASRKTDPDITIYAGDENYVRTAGYELAEGRNISQTEVENASPVAIIGQAVKENLFSSSEALGSFIKLGANKFRVIGLLQEKGSSFGFGGDKSVIIPISKARSLFNSPSQTYSLNVMALQGDNLEQAVSEATATMRIVRRLSPREKNNFHITKSDNLSQTLLENLSYVSIAAVVIGAITMLGAAIALMNIMLVSVTERTREIGIRKAIGAKSVVIRTQFLTEAILICVIGGLGGVILGIIIGNLVSGLIGGSFVVPWLWMGMAAILCLFTGLVSGFYPAHKASKLDPIESLRYE